jgi:hypothetical protein
MFEKDSSYEEWKKLTKVDNKNNNIRLSIPDEKFGFRLIIHAVGPDNRGTKHFNNIIN